MGDPEPQLDVSWVGPSTVLVINRQRTHVGLRSACRHLVIFLRAGLTG